MNKKLFLLCFSIIISSCGIKQYITFEPNTSDKTFITGDNFMITFRSVVYDLSNPNFYINVTTTDTSDITLEKLTTDLILIDGKYRNEYDMKIKKINIVVFNNNIQKSEYRIYYPDSSKIPNEFRRVKGVNNTLMYNMEFICNNKNLDQSTIKQMNLKIYAVVKHQDIEKEYSKSVIFYPKKHRYFWFLRDD